MKSPLRRLRGFGYHHHRERKAHYPPPAKLDELAHASQDLEDMRNCYDGLLSAAAATTNGVYEFSEALEEMGSCILAKTALNDDDDHSGRVLIMLGQAQFELHKSADSYRTNIIHTITTPSESLLKELQIVEEMKHQCDVKREAYEDMRASCRVKGRSKHSKIESFTTEELQSSFLEYQEDAALLIFRLKSLKQAQFHSILTQAARHHAAQLNFFRRGLKCLEALEPHVKAMAEKQHIDYQFSGLQNDESDDDGCSSYHDTCSDDGELSFDYEINDRDQCFLASKGSMDLDKRELTASPKALKETKQEDVKQPKAESVSPPTQPEFAFATHSAPIFSDDLFEQKERLRQMRPSSTRLSYKLPTPVDESNPRSAGAHRSHHSAQFFKSKPRAPPTNLWHSSPLMKDYKASTMNSGPIKMPSASSPKAISAFSHPASDSKKLKRESWSGPIPSNAGSSKPDHRSSMGYYPRAPPAKPHGHARHSSSSVSPKVAPLILPLPTISPKISELHQLPRPPASVDPLRPSGLVGYSGPLVSKRHQAPTAPARASPLPLPPAAPTLTRSYSIPSNSQRTPIITANKLLEARHSKESSSDVSSPPLSPLSLSDLSHQPSASITTRKGAL